MIMSLNEAKQANISDRVTCKYKCINWTRSN